MSSSDAWDWLFLYYAGTVLLHMTPIQFWRSTPRKLDALMNVHIDLNKAKEQNNSGTPTGFIDQAF